MQSIVYINKTETKMPTWTKENKLTEEVNAINTFLNCLFDQNMLTIHV